MPCQFGDEAVAARGGTWSLKGEYDKAIADFTEAIRLDPKTPISGRPW